MPARQKHPNFSDANMKGAFFAAFDDTAAPSYLSSISMHIDSDKEVETYPWLGTVPSMREWKGGRQKNQLNEYEWAIWNVKYENSLGISVDDVRRDKYGQHEIRAAQMGTRSAENPIILLSDLLNDGDVSLCFDGKYFFASNHVEGKSGTNDNNITIDLSDLPVLTHGSPTAPSDEEMEKILLKMVKQFYTFKDDQGQPVNQTAKSFDLVYPINMMDAVLSALSNKTLTGGRQNTLVSSKFEINPYPDARLDWTTELAMFRSDAPVKAMIHQVEVDNEIQTITQGDSEYVILNDEYFFGVKRIEGLGYGDYKKAVKATLAA